MENFIKQAANDLGTIITTIDNDFSIDKSQDYVDCIDLFKGRYNNYIPGFDNHLLESYLHDNPRRLRHYSIDKIRRDFIRIKGLLDSYLKTENYNYTQKKENNGINIILTNSNEQTQTQNQSSNLEVGNIANQISELSITQEEIEEIKTKLEYIGQKF